MRGKCLSYSGRHLRVLNDGLLSFLCVWQPLYVWCPGHAQHILPVCLIRKPEYLRDMEANRFLPTNKKNRRAVSLIWVSVSGHCLEESESFLISPNGQWTLTKWHNFPQWSSRHTKMSMSHTASHTNGYITDLSDSKTWIKEACEKHRNVQISWEGEGRRREDGVWCRIKVLSSVTLTISAKYISGLLFEWEWVVLFHSLGSTYFGLSLCARINTYIPFRDH